MSLEIKKSKIPGAGKGLFTNAPIKRGEKVIEYTGEIITWKECQARNEKMDGFGAYYFYISEKKCIDAEHILDSLARYANDAAGFIRLPGVRNNCRYEVIRNRVYVIASRNLKPGDEIFVAYGKEYWDALRHNGIGPDTKKKKVTKKKEPKKKQEELHTIAKRIETHHA
jgi:SET domain-containing protein